MIVFTILGIGSATSCAALILCLLEREAVRLVRRWRTDREVAAAARRIDDEHREMTS